SRRAGRRGLRRPRASRVRARRARGTPAGPSRTPPRRSSSTRRARRARGRGRRRVRSPTLTALAEAGVVGHRGAEPTRIPGFGTWVADGAGVGGPGRKVRAVAPPVTEGLLRRGREVARAGPRGRGRRE